MFNLVKYCLHGTRERKDINGGEDPQNKIIYIHIDCLSMK